MIREMDSLKEARKRILKKYDAASEVVLVDPITLPIAWYLAKFDFISPIGVSLTANSLRLIAGYFFLRGHFLTGAFMSIIGFYLDGIDGKIARCRNKGTTSHGIVDFVGDQVAFAFMSITLTVGLFQNPNGFILAIGCVSWISLYMLEMSITSLRNKLSLEFGQNGFSRGFRYVYSEEETPTQAVSFMRKLDKFLVVGRMYTFPTSIEAEILMFMLVPIFVAMNNWTIASLLAVFSLICLVCDIGRLGVSLIYIWNKQAN